METYDSSAAGHARLQELLSAGDPSLGEGQAFLPPPEENAEEGEEEAEAPLVVARRRAARLRAAGIAEVTADHV